MAALPGGIVKTVDAPAVRQKAVYQPGLKRAPNQQGQLGLPVTVQVGEGSLPDLPGWGTLPDSLAVFQQLSLAAVQLQDLGEVGCRPYRLSRTTGRAVSRPGKAACSRLPA